MFKHFLFRFVLLENLFQQADVGGESFASGGGQRTRRERTIVLVGFADGNVAGFLQCADVRGDVPIGHVQRVAQFGERQFGRGGEHGHDRQPPFFVNHTVEL